MPCRSIARRGCIRRASWDWAPLVRQVGNEQGVLIVDDVVVDKPHSSENEVIAYHHSHLHGGTVKGINVVHLQYSVLYEGQMINVPVGFQIVRKTAIRYNAQTGKEERYSPVSKNEMARDLLHQAHFMHHIPFSWILADSWYGNAPNIKYVVQKLKKDLLVGMKSNRKVALSKGEARRKTFVKLADLALQPGQVQEVWLDRVPFPLYVAKEIYVNADHSEGELLLVTNKQGMTYQQMISLYPERWRIEPSHKSLKNNASIRASPTKIPRTQSNHVFASFCALVQFEWLKVHTKLNHFALKHKLYSAAIRQALQELHHMKHLVMQPRA